MSEVYHIAGPARIRIGTGTGSPPALETLGYTHDGAQIREETGHLPLYADSNGGEQGAPIEVVWLSEWHTVRIELVKWDAAVAAKLLARVRKLPGGTASVAGVPPPAGLMMLGGVRGVGNPVSYRLLVHGVLEPRNYPRAIPQGVVELNKGSRHSRLTIELRCYRDPISTSPTYGVLYNADYSG